MLETYTETQMREAAQKHYLASSGMQEAINRLAVEFSNHIALNECYGLVKQSKYCKGKITGILSRGWTIDEFFAFAQYEKLIYSVWNPGFAQFKYVSASRPDLIDNYLGEVMIDALTRINKARATKHASYLRWKEKHADRYNQERNERLKNMRKELNEKLEQIARDKIERDSK